MKRFNFNKPLILILIVAGNGMSGRQVRGERGERESRDMTWSERQ